MFQLDVKNRESIYSQIVNNIKEMIVIHVLKPEDKLPSVRELSKTLIVNPNTVQKAYRELERQGYIYTMSGLGSFVSNPDKTKVNSELHEIILKKLRQNISELFYNNMTPNEILLNVENFLVTISTNNTQVPIESITEAKEHKHDNLKAFDTTAINTTKEEI